MRSLLAIAPLAAVLVSVTNAQVLQFDGPSPSLTTVLDFDSPFVGSGPISSTDPGFAAVGIRSISLIGGMFNSTGDTLTAASNVMGQCLISTNGVLAVGGAGEPLDNTGTSGGWEIVLATPVNEFQCLFVDQVNTSYTIDLLMGATLIDTGSFNYTGSFPAPAHFWRGSGMFDTVRITFPQDVGVGLDEFAFGVVAGPPPATLISIVNNLPGTFVNIAATGTALGLADDGEVDIPTTVGNTMLAAGSAHVGSNGAVRFGGTGAGLAFLNELIPSTEAFTGDLTLMPFWDDIDTASGVDGDIYYQEVGGVLIIQWEAVQFYNGGVDTVTFQIQVFPGTGPLIAQFLYASVDSLRAHNGGSATIGFQAGMSGYEDSQWSFNAVGAVMDGTVLSILASASQIGTNYCMANTNSTGGAAVMSASGSTDVVANDLALVATGLPLNAFGFFIVSSSQGFASLPGGSLGNLCLSGAIGRYIGPGEIQNAGSTGEISLSIDNRAVPSPTGSFGVVPGDVLNFQAWHRDAIGGGVTSNFTDGLEVTFQ